MVNTLKTYSNKLYVLKGSNYVISILSYLEPFGMVLMVI
jgi:hypothetical protein